MIYFALFAVLVLFLISFRVVYYSTLLVVPWIVMFTAFWSLPVAAVWYWEGSLPFAYALKNFTHLPLPSVDDNIILNVFLGVFCSSLLMLLGCLLSNSLPAIRLGVGFRLVTFNKDVSVAFIFLIWLVVVFYVSSANNLPWYYTFIPIYAESSIYLNYILRSFYLYAPFLALICVVLDNRSKKIIALVFVWGVMISFSTGQRRDLLSFLLFGLYVYLYSSKRYALSQFVSYWKAIMLFLLGIAGVVTLWVIRVFLTNIVRDGEIINPFDIRGAGEIIYGSGATGIPTLLVVMEWVDSYSLQIGYNLIYGFSQVLPRALWDKKPVGIDTIIQEEFLLKDSPSVFWYGDMVFSVGLYMLPFACLVVGFFLTMLQKSLKTSNGKFSIVASAILFCNLFSFFKNGMGTYISICLTSLVVILALLLVERIFRLSFNFRRGCYG